MELLQLQFSVYVTYIDSQAVIQKAAKIYITIHVPFICHIFTLQTLICLISHVTPQIGILNTFAVHSLQQYLITMALLGNFNLTVVYPLHG